MLSAIARCWAVWICLLLVSVPITCGAAEFQIAAAPTWVSPVDLGAVDEELRAQVSDGAYYLLSDVQVRSVHGDRVRFQHFATQALTASAVESVANIEIGFDPAFEALTLRAVEVIRDGKRISKLNASAVRILQRETELEALIYDGSKSANLLLDDVRVNDIVEYSYSLRGRNPVFGKAEFGSFRLQYGTPVARIYSRLLVGDDQQLTIAPRNTQLAPIIQTEGELRSYLWDARNVPAMIIDNGAPSWYDPIPPRCSGATTRIGARSPVGHSRCMPCPMRCRRHWSRKLRASSQPMPATPSA